MEKPGDLIDRDREWAQLTRAAEEPGPELALVLGRRRAGKSFLLTRFVEAAGGVYYQATKQTEREQLQSVSRALGERFGDAALKRVALADWDDVLGYVVEQAAGAPFVFVLDEFPFLVDAAPALPSILQSWWDHRLAETRVTLVLSGSHVTAMKRLVEHDQPLYGRRTARLDVRPFDAFDAARFVTEWDARDKVRLYAVFGGLPGHLALVDPSRDARRRRGAAYTRHIGAALRRGIARLRRLRGRRRRSLLGRRGDRVGVADVEPHYEPGGQADERAQASSRLATGHGGGRAGSTGHRVPAAEPEAHAVLGSPTPTSRSGTGSCPT